MKRPKLQLLLFFPALTLFFTATAHATVISSYALGEAVISGTTAGYPITLDFADDEGNEVVFFSVDVASSNALLSVGATDYSAFSLAKSLPLLVNWSEVSSFGVGPLMSVEQLDTFSGPLPNGTYLLGTLSVDFAGSTLVAGMAGAVRIDAPDSVIGIAMPGDPSSFRFVAVDVVPEPAARILAIFLTLGMILKRRTTR